MRTMQCPCFMTTRLPSLSTNACWVLGGLKQVRPTSIAHCCHAMTVVESMRTHGLSGLSEVHTLHTAQRIVLVGDLADTKMYFNEFIIRIIKSLDSDLPNSLVDIPYPALLVFVEQDSTFQRTAEPWMKQLRTEGRVHIYVK